MTSSSKAVFEQRVAGKTFLSHGSREITSPEQLRDACEREQALHGVRSVVASIAPGRAGSLDLAAVFGPPGEAILDDHRLTREEFSLDGERARVCVLYLWHLGGEVHGALFLPGKREALCTMREGQFDGLEPDVSESLWDAHRTWPEETTTPERTKPAARPVADQPTTRPEAARSALRTLTAASKKQFTSRASGKAFVRRAVRVITSSAQLTDRVERVQVLNGVASVLAEISPDSGRCNLRMIFGEGGDPITDDARVTREDFSLAGSTRLACTLYAWHLGDNEHGALFLPGTGQALCLMHDGDLELPRTIGRAITAARGGPPTG